MIIITTIKIIKNKDINDIIIMKMVVVMIIVIMIKLMIMMCDEVNNVE